MKKGYALQSLTLVCLLAVSCSINEMDTKDALIASDEIFYATLESYSEPDTKVYVDENVKILWDEDDRITIFNKYTYNQEYRFLGETGDNAGGFRKVPSDDFITGNDLNNVYAVYPYLETTKISNKEVMTITLPSEQSYREGSFGPGANVMTSATEDNMLRFKNVGGYLVLKFYGAGVSVSSIKLEGNNGELLSGKATVTHAVEGVPSVTMATDAGTSITLNCPTPVELGETKENATIFWLVVPPTKFTGGFTLTVMDANGGEFVKKTTANLSIARNGVLRISPIEVKPASVNPNYSRYLTFEVETAGTIEWVKWNTDEPNRSVFVSINNGDWTSMTSSADGVSIDVSAGDILRFYGENKSYMGSHFCGTARFKAYGNIMSLLSRSFVGTANLSEEDVFDNLFSGCSGLFDAKDLVLPATSLTSGCYANMFSDCSSLEYPPELPATSLTSYCYSSMFNGCSNLVSAPSLPAQILTEGCYHSMFRGCTSLSSAPDLPACSLAKSCYSYMFISCTSMVTAPVLPATTLADNCYQMMFSSCVNLVSAPSLPAVRLSNYCYDGMFGYCYSLTSAPELPATELAFSCYSYMFQYCKSLTTAPDLLAETLVYSCYQGMFRGCTHLNSIKCFANPATAKDSSLQFWVSDVSSTGLFTSKSEWSSPWPRGESGIPKNWGVYSVQQ